MARWTRRIARVAVAAGLAATAYVALPASPATAAGCPTADGVTVVVDFHELGGGVPTACVADGGGDRASDLFPAAGFALDYVQRQPGFVCKVAGEPSDSSCVSTPPADAYWALYWSDGKSGKWTYATTSAGGLTVPEGGYVGFSWVGSDQSAPPGTTPAVHASPTPTEHPSSEPTKQPTKQASGQPAQQSSSASAPASGSASAGAEPSAKPGKATRKPRGASASASASSSVEATPSASATDEAVVPTSAEPPDAGGDGLPTWVAPAAIVVLFGAAGAVAVARRRRSGPA